MIITVALLSLAVGTDLETLLLMCPENNNANVKIPNPHDCSSYFACINDFPVVIFCPESLLFDINSLTCTTPDVVHCQPNGTLPLEVVEGSLPPVTSHEASPPNEESDVIFQPFGESEIPKKEEVIPEAQPSEGYTTLPPSIKESNEEPIPLEEYTTLPPFINEESTLIPQPAEEYTLTPQSKESTAEPKHSDEYTTLSSDTSSSADKWSHEVLEALTTLPPTDIVTISPQEEKEEISNTLPPEIDLKIQTSEDESIPSKPQSTFDTPSVKPAINASESVHEQEQNLLPPDQNQPIYPFPAPIEKPDPPAECNDSDCSSFPEVPKSSTQETDGPPSSNEQQQNPPQQPQYPTQSTTELPQYQSSEEQQQHPKNPLPPSNQQPQQPPSDNQQNPWQHPQHPTIPPNQQPQYPPPNPWHPIPPPSQQPQNPYQPPQQLKKCPPHNFVQVYFPNPVDCHSFYQCNWGVPRLRHCPGNLHFNPRLNVCDWPSNARCHLLFHH